MQKVLKRTTPALRLLTWMVALNGCQNACPNGPACEEEWPAAALAVHQWEEAEEPADVWDDANSLLWGSANEGSDWRVASTGETLWIGMPDVNTVKQYRLDGSAILETGAVWESIEGGFGAQVEALDLDGDGEPELVVSAPDWSLQRGLIAFFRQNESTEPQTIDDAFLRVTGSESGDHLGSTLAVCGDLSGDGKPDLAVHIPWLASSGIADSPTLPPLAGAVVLLRSELLLEASGSQPWNTLGPVWWGDQEGDALGYALRCEDDIDGDGQADLLMGAPWAGEDDAGKVYGILGGALPDSGSITVARDMEITGTGESSWAGMAVSTLLFPSEPGAGVVVGEPGYNQGRGRTIIYSPALLRASPLSPKYLYRLRGSEEPGGAMHFGRSIEEGDVDGDLLNDLVIGAPDFRYDRRSDAGRTWIYLGKNATSWSQEGTAEETADATIWGKQAFLRVGRSMKVADLNTDGRDDILLPTRAASP
jgi:hypothetical protein